jgi:hypothetical protein
VESRPHSFLFGIIEASLMRLAADLEFSPKCRLNEAPVKWYIIVSVKWIWLEAEKGVQNLHLGLFFSPFIGLIF